MDLNNKDIINPLVKGCKNNDRVAQKKLYMLFYPYLMSICLRYTDDEEEAKDVLNEAFLKIFTKIKQHSPTQSFKAWARRIAVNTAIDHYRKNKKFKHHLEISQADSKYVEPDVIAQFSSDDILKLVQKLPNSYQLVFNLYVVEGYSHKEIGKKLDINEGTSKSNLSKARAKLKIMLEAANREGEAYYG